MNDNTISDIMPEESGSSGVKVYATIASLGGQTPELGDEVTLTVVGTVDSIDGDAVCVSPSTVNGEPAPGAPVADNETADLRQKSMDEAEQMDSASY